MSRTNSKKSSGVSSSASSAEDNVLAAYLTPIKGRRGVVTDDSDISNAVDEPIPGSKEYVLQRNAQNGK